MVGWLVGWLVDWLVGWFAGWIGWLVGLLVACLVGWLLAWLVGLLFIIVVLAMIVMAIMIVTSCFVSRLLKRIRNKIRGVVGPEKGSRSKGSRPMRKHCMRAMFTPTFFVSSIIAPKHPAYALRAATKSEPDPSENLRLSWTAFAYSAACCSGLVRQALCTSKGSPTCMQATIKTPSATLSRARHKWVCVVPASRDP